MTHDRTVIRAVVQIAGIALICNILALAQGPATGTPAFGSFGGGPFDVINLGNLNVHFSIPVVSKPGRGIPFTYNLGYDSSVWYVATVNGQATWQPTNNWGWHGETEVVVGYLLYGQSARHCIDPDTGYLVWYLMNSFGQYHDSFNVQHNMSVTTIDDPDGICQQPVPDGSATAVDGSGYTLQVTNYTDAQVTAKNGSVIYPPLNTESGSGVVTDSNGNQITTNGTTFTDTLGTTALTISGSGTATSPLNYTYASPTGQQPGPSVQLHYATKTVQTNFSCSGVYQFPATQVDLVDYVQMPDLTRYSISYEQTPGYPNSVTGRIASVTLPTGGTITYSYSGGSNGIVCADGSTAGLTRTVTPGNSQPAGTWTYSRTVSSTSSSTTIVDPESNQTVINFQVTNNNFYETSRQVKQGASTVLATVTTCYNSSSDSCDSTPVTLPITASFVRRKFPDSTGRVWGTDLFYNSWGQTTEVDEYDAFIGGTGGLLRKTLTSYANLGNGIVDRPSSVTVQDGSGNTKAQTNFTYDQGTPATTSGTPQHVGISGSRGNPTTVSQLVQGSTYLTKTFTYFDTGLVQTATDVNGAQTTYTYGECGNSFPSSTALPLSLTTSAHWDCNGGVMLWTKDPNQQGTQLQTAYTYGDANFWRITQVSYPDSGLTTYTYNTTTPNAWNVGQSAKIDASHNLATTTRVDGFGRTIRQELNSDPDSSNSNDYVDTTYDAVGRVASVSNPYRTVSDSTYGLTGYQYDALNRVTQITRQDGTSTTLFSYTRGATLLQDEGNGSSRVQRVLQLDGLGRLGSVCEVTTTSLFVGVTPTPAWCGQDISQTGFATTYSYDALDNLTQVVQGGLSNRNFTYDGLSRLTSEGVPEASNATITYTYDGSGAAGDLATRTSPKQNQSDRNVTVTTTYTHDALHRLTGISYNDALTPTVTYSYDQQAPWGWNLSNYKGRLTTESVSSNGTLIVGNLYNYDPMGRVTIFEECPPQNCINGTSYAIAYGYDLMGNITNANNNWGVSLSYSYTNAAQLAQLSSNLNDSQHPPNLISGMHYNALGQLTGATLGNGVALSRDYNARGWPKYIADGSVYTVNSSGSPMTYTPNGNLLGNSDNVNGSWTYAYDDFNRLLSSNKNSGQQTFTYDYDRFGNRWHQNAPQGGPQPQYSFDANNRVTTSGVVVDAAGNITNDGLPGGHSYKYDAENRLIQVDNGATASYIYDAEGRRVQRTNGSAHTDFIYDQAGRVVLEVNATAGVANRWEIYTLGRSVATYIAATTVFNHADWQGTVRAHSNVSGASVQTCTGLPFGDPTALTCTGTGTNIWGPAHFTGDEHDSESNLEHTWFRQYIGTQGRWMSPDPAGLAAVDLSNPQSLNRYAYVGNNPTGYIDPYGLKVCPECVSLHNNSGGMGSTWNEFDVMRIPVTVGWGRYYDDEGPSWGGTSRLPGFLWPPVETLGVELAGTGGPEDKTKTCAGIARGLQGNSSLYGKKGSFAIVQPNTAAIIPRQFGFSTDVAGRSAMMPFVSQISGTLTARSVTSTFSSVTDVIGGKSPLPGVPVRDALMQLFPGRFIVEVPGGADVGAHARVTLTVPSAMQCPAGTTEVKP